MTTTEMKAKRTQGRTWLGVPGEQFEMAKNKNERVSWIRWAVDADDANGIRKAGDVTISHASGDFRKGTGVTHESANLGPVGNTAAEDWARVRLVP